MWSKWCLGHRQTRRLKVKTSCINKVREEWCKGDTRPSISSRLFTGHPQFAWEINSQSVIRRRERIGVEITNPAQSFQCPKKAVRSVICQNKRFIMKNSRNTLRMENANTCSCYFDEHPGKVNRKGGDIKHTSLLRRCNEVQFWTSRKLNG